MTIDFEQYRILLNDNKTIYLTKTEKTILELLFNNKKKIVKYEEIIPKIYETNVDEGLKNALRKNISLLNKKINKYIKIKNIRNVGYIIEEDLK